MTSMRNKVIEGIMESDIFSFSHTFTEDDVIQFADTPMDYNPVHLEDRFAKVKNFKSRICHGLLEGSMLTAI